MMCGYGKVSWKSVVLITPNVFQLYAVVVSVVLPFTYVLKLIKDILFKFIPQATIA